MWKSTTLLAKDRRVSSQTVRRWIEEGKYDRVERTAGGHYRVWDGVEKTAVILYARASSAKQKSSVESQEKLLLKRYPNGEFKSDIGSGFNQKRRSYLAVLERALQGESIQLVATTSDRITRSGFQIVKSIIELHGGEIELLEEDVPEQFDVAVLIAFITSFCNSVHGRRSSRRHRQDDSQGSGIPKEG